MTASKRAGTQAGVVQERLQEDAAVTFEAAELGGSLAGGKASVLEEKLDLVLVQKQVLAFLDKHPN